MKKPGTTRISRCQILLFFKSTKRKHNAPFLNIYNKILGLLVYVLKRSIVLSFGYMYIFIPSPQVPSCVFSLSMLPIFAMLKSSCRLYTPVNPWARSLSGNCPAHHINASASRVRVLRATSISCTCISNLTKTLTSEHVIILLFQSIYYTILTKQTVQCGCINENFLTCLFLCYDYENTG